MKNLQKQIAPQDSDIALKAKTFAIDMHNKVGQKYGDFGYHMHLYGVVNTLEKYSSVISHMTLRQQNNTFAAAWLHDTLEDCGAHVNFNTLKREFNVDVAEMVYALTNSKGRNPEEREDQNYFAGLQCNFGAKVVKICDRISNTSFSKSQKSNHFNKYSRKAPNFCEELWCVKVSRMISDLLSLSNIIS